VTVLTISGKLPTASAANGLLAVSMFNLAKEHSLTKAGLRRVHIVETAELGLRPGDIDTGMACRRDGIIPPDVDIMTIHKEAAAIRTACNRKAQEEEQLNVLPFRRAV
jgi:hypothetical protein